MGDFSNIFGYLQKIVMNNFADLSKWLNSISWNLFNILGAEKLCLNFNIEGAHYI